MIKNDAKNTLQLEHVFAYGNPIRKRLYNAAFVSL